MGTTAAHREAEAASLYAHFSPRAIQCDQLHRKISPLPPCSSPWKVIPLFFYTEHIDEAEPYLSGAGLDIPAFLFGIVFCNMSEREIGAE
jgi:hypothetical protein